MQQKILGTFIISCVIIFFNFTVLTSAETYSEILNFESAKIIVNNISSDKQSVGMNKVVGLDYYYNHELEKDKSGKMVQFHYIWEDTANSGYSEIGGVIKGLGAKLGELHHAATLNSLKKFSIYIIVDPDTPAETKNPHYIEPPAIKDIVEWVKSGGVLVLLGNDKGNAEFKHLNMLAENFGIHFIEDSRNDVQGKKYYQGKFDHLPDHPIFKGVSEIYMKGICTLKLKKPAEPVLTDKSDIIMAYSKFGKGFVFAVGDPWFYNEYIYHRYLPAEYENGKAAKNLFDWLLQKARPVSN